MDANYAKKQYRTVGLTVLIISIALLLMRIVSYYVSIAMINSPIDGAWGELLIDAAFTVPVQVGILLVFPLLMYRFVLKKRNRELLSFSGYRKINIWVCLLSVLLGFLTLWMSCFFSVIWQTILILFGFTPSSGSTLPESFNAGYFVVTILLTAVLPAICEECTNRGGLLTTIRSNYSEPKTIFLMGLAFGLFHQNISQFLYTAMLGAMLVYLVLKTQSIIPAMIVHFMNNFTSIYLDFADAYGWVVGRGFFDFIAGANVAVLLAVMALVTLGIFWLLFAITKLSKRKVKFDEYAALNAATTAVFKPSTADNAFYIGAIVVTASATLLTFIFGL